MMSTSIYTRPARLSVYYRPENHQHAHFVTHHSQNRPLSSLYSHLIKMQFTTLFSFATSLALASAGVIQTRQFDGAIAVVDVFDYETADCAGDEATVKIGVGSKATDQCIPFSQGYKTVSYSYLEPGYSSKHMLNSVP